MISINRVTFNYRKNSKSILNNINLEIKDKEIFGILGPSGAGKTTLIKLITGQLDSQNGEILVDGCKPDVHNREFNRKFGIMMDGLGLYERLTCYENVLLFARIYNVIDSYVVDVLKQVGLGEHLNKTVNKLSTGMKQRVLLARAIIHSPAILVLDEPNRKFGIMMDGLGLYERLTCYENVLLFARIYNVIDSYVVDVLKQVGLGEHLNKTVNKLSTGMKQRVLLARAIIHSPAILVLDEPTSGLDPVTADEIHKIIKEIRHMGTTVLLTTHNMNEADKLCNRIALLNKGGIIECNEPEAIKRKYFKSGSVCIHTKNEKDIYLDLEKQKSELINLIHSGDIETIHSQEPCLEDIFINLTGEKINDK